MARFADWVELANTTLRSLQARDMTRIYQREWPETMKSLTADHRESIEREQRKANRWLRTASAMMYGLVRRLAPHRRLLFAGALLISILNSVHLLDDPHLSLKIMLGSIVPPLVLTFLLALELIDKIHFRNELELARELQKGLVPQELPQTDEFQLAAFNSVANTVGGDIYDFVPLPDGRLAVLFGDASGHGMAAGLLMAVAHAAFRTQLDIDPRPEAIVSSLNRILCRTGGRRSFFACAYILVERGGSYEACLAGHPPVLHVPRGGGRATAVGTGSYPLGIRPALEWRVEKGRLEPGDSLVLYSDGLVEARGVNDDEYGYERAEKTFTSWHRASADGILTALLDDWNRHVQERAIDDDVSVAVIRRKN